MRRGLECQVKEADFVCRGLSKPPNGWGQRWHVSGSSEGVDRLEKEALVSSAWRGKAAWVGSVIIRGDKNPF